jgi:alkanesulfonate monooxygenase SsuD/methylene tetrahydromethanopterin reductase-like flavin-dependent oxidoreductase (luciferase family)
MINFTLSFDMRVPDLGTAPKDIYSAALDMCAYGDQAGIPYVNLMEHHGAKDGYLPAPLVMAAAVAARTQQMRIIVAALLLPLHDPVKVAEQMAVADLISNGRLDVVFGTGYVKSEFDMFGRSMKDRGKALDEGIPVIQRALQGERFVFNGRPVHVTPRPVQKPYPLLYAGGGVEASAKRGARLGIGFMPMNPALVPLYISECERLGHKPGPVFTGLNWLHVSDTPAKTRREVEPHLLHYCRSYAEFTEGASSSSPFEGMTTIEAIEKSGLFYVVTPEECAKMAIETWKKMRGRFSIAPLIGGLSPKVGWKSLELLVDKVLPLMGHGKQRTKVAVGAKATTSRKTKKAAIKKAARKKAPAKRAAVRAKAKVKKSKAKRRR